MKVLELTLNKKGGAEPLSFSVKRMVNAGFVGRDQEAVRGYKPQCLKT